MVSYSDASVQIVCCERLEKGGVKSLLTPIFVSNLVLTPIVAHGNSSITMYDFSDKFERFLTTCSLTDVKYCFISEDITLSNIIHEV